MPLLKIFDGSTWQEIWGSPSIEKVNWNETNANSTAYIWNKPNILGGNTPKVPSNISYNIPQLRNIIYSTSEPNDSDGNNGDLWIIYEE